MFPGADRRVVRALAARRLKVATMAFAAAFETRNELQMEITKRHTDEWLAEVARAAQDPMYAASANAHILCAEEASYLTVVANGITLSFCRGSLQQKELSLIHI